jgi:hypothetical protein
MAGDAMSRTLTVRLPNAIQLARGFLILVAAIAIIAAGAFVASRLTSAGAVRGFAQSGRLQEIRLTDGTVVVGQIESDAGGYLTIDGAAEVRAGSGTQAGATIVQMITADPVDAGGEMLIADGQIVAIMNVTTGSGLETAYRQATGQLPAPSPAPSARPSAS